MACADADMDIQAADEEPRGDGCRETARTRYYQASEILPDNKGPLHDLLQKQPAVLGSLQMLSGLLSVGVGVLFAVTQDMRDSLFTLFRVSQLTGALFIFAGLTSNLLFKYPGLLPVSFVVNCGCIIVAAVAACLIGVDLSHWNDNADRFHWNLDRNEYLRMELLELCVLGFEVLLSAILCFWFSKEKRSMTKLSK